MFDTEKEWIDDDVSHRRFRQSRFSLAAYTTHWYVPVSDPVCQTLFSDTTQTLNERLCWTEYVSRSFALRDSVCILHIEKAISNIIRAWMGLPSVSFQWPLWNAYLDSFGAEYIHIYCIVMFVGFRGCNQSLFHICRNKNPEILLLDHIFPR